MHSMLITDDLVWFALAAFVLGLTPGPNMAYCLSRTLCQGRVAGLISLAGILAAYGVHVMCTALGLTAVLMTSEAAFDAIKILGATYLLYLAWRIVRPGAAALPILRGLRRMPGLTTATASATATTAAVSSASALFCMGFFVNLLNPKAVLFYVALLPQFLRPDRGAVIAQSLQLGAVQVAMSGAVMGLLVCGVSRLQPLIGQQQGIWLNITRYAMGTVFAALAVRLLTLRLS